ncbi:MAG: putative peroxidase-related enzyme [Chlamydiales bacterium]
MLKDDGLLGRVEADFEQAGLDPRRLAMLRYATKLTRTPAAMEREDVAALRAVGFEDSDVLAICEVTAYYAYVNRIADGLGVTLEPWNEETTR